MHRLTIMMAGLVMAATGLMAGESRAAGAEPPKIDRLRAYLLWEDTGDLSKNMANEDVQILANGEKGQSVQMLVDVVMKAKPQSLYEGEQPFLYVTALPLGAQVGDPPMLDTGFPISFISDKGQVVRTVLIDHNCEGFELNARVMVGNDVKSEVNKRFEITCGD